MAAHTKATYATLAPSRAPSRAPSAAGLVGVLERWSAVSAERRALSSADERMLADIGLSRADAVREASRPFWDLPNGR